MERTELSELGEFGLINRITEGNETTHTRTIKGTGDDAAVLDRGNHYEVITTDMLLEGIHFDLSYTPLKHLGYKAVVANVSDVCAMNAIPEHITVSIALSNRFSVEAVDELYEGIYLACKSYGIDLIGGDTTSSLTGLIISITALGSVQKDKVSYRSGARENDLLCVTGDLGAAYIGLQILEREKQIWKENPSIQPDLSGNDYVLERILKPEARLDVVKKLEEAGIVPTSMIDISDGLASEALHICEQSNCGVNIYAEKLPIDPTVSTRAQEFQLDPVICALNGGEDYELLFTVGQNHYEQLRSMSEISIIGHITEKAEGAKLIFNSGDAIELKAQGWKAF